MSLSGILKSFFIFLGLSLFTAITKAQLKIAEIFSSNMVLQRDKPLIIWGQASAGKAVKLVFADQQQSTTADTDGKWQVILKPLQLSTLPQQMQISSETTIILQNILVGDVWLCTGQSNMEYPLDRASKKYALPAKGTDLALDELNKTDKPDAVRYIYAEHTLNKYPLLPTKGWINAKDSTLRFVSAIGYFFAKEIYEQTKIPIGIISSSWGGTRVEQWTPPFAYTQYSHVFDQFITSDTFKIDGMKPGQMYKGMIEPLLPFALKGVLWYQGESNCMVEDQDTYVEKMKIFEECWRDKFKDSKLPFYTVQISPFLYTSRKDPKKHSEDLLPRFWEAQTNTMALPHTHMIVTTDLVDNLKDIHPSYKWVVAHRLALQALNTEYGKKDLISNSPGFKKLKRKGNKLVVTFTNTGGELSGSDGAAISWFSISAGDSNFVTAKAVIDGEKIILEADGIRKPKQVRFAWSEAARPNLVNKAGLPCIPFRSDKF